MNYVNTAHRSHNQRLFAVDNDFGLVELFDNPNGAGAKSATFKLHSEHVTNVRSR
jgi:hypothetical protein